MLKVLSISFIYFLLSPISTIGQSTNFNPKFAYTIDSNNASKFLSECTRVVPEKIKKFWTPTKSDIINLESNFRKLYSFKSNVGLAKGEKVSNLKEFSFQYVGIIQDEKKRIYINAFPEKSGRVHDATGANLKETPVGVCDGGNSFWGAVFDLENKTFIFLAFNDQG